jgi:iron complex outermembrane receptor protein
MPMSKLRGVALCGAAFVALLPAIGPALAQDKIEEVVVTAMRRAEPLREVPLSVTAIDSKTLEDRHITDPSQLVFAAPSLQVQSNNASPVASFFSVRGIGTLAFVKFIEQSVGVDVDGVALVRPEAGILAFYDVDDVEVLNGPQGMLFGKNASAGLINITTKNPEIGQFGGYVTAEYGNMTTPSSGNEYQTQGVLNIPVSDDSALRLTGVYMHSDPLVKDVFTSANEHYGHDEGGGRVKYLWQPSNALSIMIAGDYAVSNGVGAGETTDRSVVPGDLNASLDTAVGVTPGPRNVYNSSNAPTNDRFQSGGLQANITYTLPSGSTLTNIAAWRDYSENGQGDNDDHQTNVEDFLAGQFNFSQFSEELRYASPIGQNFDYQAGVYYVDARIAEQAKVFGNAGLGPPPPPFTTFLGFNAVDVDHTSSAAFFGQGTYHVTDKFRILAGARFTHDSVDNFSEAFSTSALSNLLAPGITPKNTVHHDNISWRGSVQYDFTPEVMGYVTVAQGYKGPGFNQFSAQAVPPETSHQYEAGVKSELFDNHLALNVAAYSEVFDNFQDQTYFPVAPYYAVLSAGRLDSRGFEVQADALITDGLTISANVAYVDATFGSFVGDQCYTGEATSVTPSRNACYMNHSNSTGNTLANAPKWAGTISANYVRPLGSTYQIEFGGSLYSRSGVNFSSNDNPNTTQSGYTLLGLNAGIGPQDGDWKFSVFCRNCTDRRFVTYIEPAPFFSADYGQQFGPDSFRTIGVNLRKSF